MGVAFAHPLAVGIVGIGEVFHALLQGAAAEPGQPALAPGGSPAVIGSRTAHGVVGTSTVATNILPPTMPAVKKKPPRP